MTNSPVELEAVSEGRLREIVSRKPVGNAIMRTVELQAIVSELLALREAAAEVIAQNRDYLTHLNNGAQTDPLTRAIEALALLSPTPEDEVTK